MPAAQSGVTQLSAEGVAHLAGKLVLIAESAQVFALSDDESAELAVALGAGTAETHAALSRLGLDAPPPRLPGAPATGPIRALALTVSQTCNLACGYCYAGGGAFGGPDRVMSWPVARDAIDRLIGDAMPGTIVRIAFMGGEPLVARDLIRRAVDHANARAATRAVRVGYSMTTNGTLIRPDDAAFLAQNRFAVTLSLDGGRAVQDRLRPDRAGKGSFDRIAARLHPLLDRRGEIALSARVTVTPENLDLPQVVSDIAALGIPSVGVAPMLSSPTGQGALSGADFDTLLAAMIACGEDWLDATLRGRPHPFANLATLLEELHRGQPRDHSCGAARDYLAVDASGTYSACHRFVGDAAGAMGDLATGVDDAARATFLDARQVGRQDDCARCWARRLCGGGCHHEVLSAGRPACDFVRGWLDYGLRVYGRLHAERSDWFATHA